MRGSGCTGARSASMPDQSPRSTSRFLGGQRTDTHADMGSRESRTTPASRGRLSRHRRAPSRHLGERWCPLTEASWSRIASRPPRSPAGDRAGAFPAYHISLLLSLAGPGPDHGLDTPKDPNCDDLSGNEFCQTPWAAPVSGFVHPPDPDRGLPPHEEVITVRWHQSQIPVDKFHG